MEQSRKWCAWMLGVPLWAAQAGADELWLVELEHNDGIRLQFQGAELELGSAALAGGRQFSDLKPGMKLAILSRNGVAEHIRLYRHAPESEPAAQWRRAEGTLLAVTGHALQLQGLGTITFDAGTRWLNGGSADLQPGRTLVLTRDETGRVTEILIPNPEDEPK